MQNKGVDTDYIIEDIVSESNVYWAISSFKNFTSPGPEGIFPAHLEQSHRYIKVRFFKKILNY